MATISSLSAGAKIAITESSSTALYTLIHHDYNDGKAMLLRDSSIGTSAWRSTAPSSSTNNIFTGSTLDLYLISWYDTLPSSTTQYLTTLEYPVTDANYSGNKVYISRGACTISLAETDIANHANWQDIGDFDYLDTVGCGVLYWTRQPSAGTNYAYRITADGTDYGTVSVTTTTNVRPTLGVSEDQYVEYDSSLGAYVLADASAPTTCGAPSTLYLWGVETDRTDVELGEEMYLSWSAGTGTSITGYAVYTSTSLNSGYTLYTTTTNQYIESIPAPTSYSTTLYFRVQTLGEGGISGSYNSELSTAYRYVTTKAAESTGTQLDAPATLYLDGGEYNFGNASLGASYTLSWDAVTGDTLYGYSVYYSTSANGTYAWMKDVTTTSTTVYAPDTYSTYRYFKVKAISVSGSTDSALSTSYRSVYTTASPENKCSPPETLYLNGSSSGLTNVAPGTEVTLSWDAATGAVSSYYVYYKDSVDSSWLYVGYTTSLSMTVTAPNVYSTSRYFSVMVSSSVLGGDSGFSELIALTTKAETVNYGVSYYDGTQWLSPTPWYYNGSAWVRPTMWYYDGSTWLPIPPLPDCSYSVEGVSGAPYGFELNSNGYYESTNFGVDSSYSLCKVNIVADGVSNVYVDCINYAETYCDYGILSNVDTALEFSNTADSSNVFKSFASSSSADVQTVDYGVLTAGEHYIYIKYRKDGSVNSNNDSLQFKVRFE